MKYFLIFVLTLVSFAAFAKEDSKHMVTFGSDFNSGWNLSSTKSDVSGTGIDSYDITKGNLNLNYAYRILNQLQIGASMTSGNYETEYEVSGVSTTNTDKTTSFYLFGVFNFSEDFTESFYVMGGFGKETVEKTTNGVTTFKDEYDVSSYIFSIGKRLNLKFAGIENLTYSPALTYKYGTVSGDLADTGVDTLSSLQLDIVKFDLLF